VVNTLILLYVSLQHNIKKLRNNLSKSKASGTKNLMVGSKCIAWKQWIEAFNWDQANSLPFHHRLTTKHFQLGYSSKMRNHLAEQVLNEDMLNLVKVCQLFEWFNYCLIRYVFPYYLLYCNVYSAGMYMALLACGY